MRKAFARSKAFARKLHGRKGSKALRKGSKGSKALRKGSTGSKERGPGEGARQGEGLCRRIIANMIETTVNEICYEYTTVVLADSQVLRWLLILAVIIANRIETTVNDMYYEYPTVVLADSQVLRWLLILAVIIANRIKTTVNYI